jgi:hypothetical protein
MIYKDIRKNIFVIFISVVITNSMHAYDLRFIIIRDFNFFINKI